jgi:hypothetical protein
MGMTLQLVTTFFVVLISGEVGRMTHSDENDRARRLVLTGKLVLDRARTAGLDNLAAVHIQNRQGKTP